MPGCQTAHENARPVVHLDPGAGREDGGLDFTCFHPTRSSQALPLMDLCPVPALGLRPSASISALTVAAI